MAFINSSHKRLHQCINRSLQHCQHMPRSNWPPHRHVLPLIFPDNLFLSFAICQRNGHRSMTLANDETPLQIVMAECTRLPPPKWLQLAVDSEVSTVSKEGQLEVGAFPSSELLLHLGDRFWKCCILKVEREQVSTYLTEARRGGWNWNIVGRRCEVEMTSNGKEMEQTCTTINLWIKWRMAMY